MSILVFISVDVYKPKIKEAKQPNSIKRTPFIFSILGNLFSILFSFFLSVKSVSFYLKLLVLPKVLLGFNGVGFMITILFL
jgi:hypothetical protein